MLLLEDLQRPRLAIPQLALQQSWDNSATLPRVEHRWNCYLNQLALATLTPWADEQRSQVQPLRLSVFLQSLPKTGLSRNQFWQWTTGAAMAVAGQRWIIIPTDALDVEEFRVPQEWVDIPSCSGDYYVMVQLDPEAGWLQVRGYLNHRHLKQKATYNSGDRTFCINDDDLIQDIDLLWVMSELESATERRAELAAIPSLSEQQVQPLIEQICQQLERSVSVAGQLPLSQTTPSPRLMLSFEQWAGILENAEYRSRLERSAQEALSPDNSTTTSLRQWLAGQFSDVWKSRNQRPSFRWNGGLRQMPAQSVSRGKRLTLQEIQPALMLWTTVTEADDDRMLVLVQLRHQAEDAEGLIVKTLPKDLSLILLSPAEESLTVVTARAQDDYIQLPRFRVRSGQFFSVEIRLGDQVIRERFRA